MYKRAAGCLCVFSQRDRNLVAVTFLRTANRAVREPVPMASGLYSTLMRQRLGLGS